MASLASAAPGLNASKAAEDRTPAAELITKARRFMDVSFTSDTYASFKIFWVKAGRQEADAECKRGSPPCGDAITGQE
jgi:hypothetical protein